MGSHPPRRQEEYHVPARRSVMCFTVRRAKRCPLLADAVEKVGVLSVIASD
jgi:hypothetical protein